MFTWTKASHPPPFTLTNVHAHFDQCLWTLWLLSVKILTNLQMLLEMCFEHSKDEFCVLGNGTLSPCPISLDYEDFLNWTKSLTSPYKGHLESSALTSANWKKCTKSMLCEATLVLFENNFWLAENMIFTSTIFKGFFALYLTFSLGLQDF